jgi:hypothetical protein
MKTASRPLSAANFPRLRQESHHNLLMRLRKRAKMIHYLTIQKTKFITTFVGIEQCER